jgi:carboxylesterase
MIIPTAEPFFFPGNRTGCLLIHGFTGTPKEMHWMGEYLVKQGCTVLGIRLSCHATQPEDMLRSRSQDWLHSVEDGWHILSGCTDRIFLLGLSMGGLLSLIFAADHPVAGIVIMATPHHLPNDPRLKFIKLYSLWKPTMPKARLSEGREWYDEGAERQHVSYDVDPTRSYAELVQLINQMQAALHRIYAPTLFIYSKNDPVVLASEGHMDKMYTSISSTDKNMLWVENSGHVITEDAERQRVFQAAAEFIAQHSQVGG